MAKFNLDPDRPIKVNKSLPEGICDRLPDKITDEEKRREFFMGEALKLAKSCEKTNDVPVGCVIVRHNEIIAAACNRREAEKAAVAHAETLAIADACRALGGWRLVSCELYVTLEPCPMCAGAIMNARVPTVYIGCNDQKGGAMGGLFDLFSMGVNHKPKVIRNILKDQCSSILSDFFKNKR